MGEIVAEVPTNWWRAAALNPDSNLLIVADSLAWTLDLRDSITLSLFALADLGGDPSTATDEQIISMSVNRILAFTPIPDPKSDGDLVIINNN